MLTITVTDSCAITDSCAALPVLVLCGEVWSADCARLSDALDRLMDAGARDVVLDMAAVDYCSRDGLSALIMAARRLHQRGGAIAIARPRPITRRKLAITQLDTVFVVANSVAEARLKLQKPG